MTLEEAISSANNGNISCMIMVGDFFGNNEDLQPGERYKQALPWYRKAASVGSIDGADRARLICAIFGGSYKEIGAWNRAVDYYSEAYHYTNMILEESNLDREFVKIIKKEKQEYSYEIALGNFILENKTVTLKLTTENPELKKYTKAIMLRAISSYDLAETEADFDEAQELLDIYESYELKAIFSEIENESEELMLSLGYNYLANDIRIREGDTIRAYNIVYNGYNTVHLDTAKSFLEKELSHYKKKMFGGFQYVE